MKLPLSDSTVVGFAGLKTYISKISPDSMADSGRRQKMREKAIRYVIEDDDQTKQQATEQQRKTKTEK